MKFHHFSAPLEKSTIGPHWKKSFRRPWLRLMFVCVQLKATPHTLVFHALCGMSSKAFRWMRKVTSLSRKKYLWRFRLHSGATVAQLVLQKPPGVLFDSKPAAGYNFLTASVQFNRASAWLLKLRTCLTNYSQFKCTVT